MKTRFIIDLTTGLVSRSIAGAPESDDWAATLVAGDLMDCEVVFLANGADATTTALAGDAIATLGVRAVPGVDPLLAMSTPLALAGAVGTCTLDLHTTELMDLVNALDATKTSTKVWFEAVVGGLTVAQQRMTLRREVMAEGDEPPPTAEASRISASESAAAAHEDRLATDAAAEATADDRLQTTSDREYTAADAEATAADRVQTGLDRVATGQDKTGTAADCVQTGLDRVATGQDKAGTAADRVQTGLDRTAADADAIATAGDRVQIGLDRTAAATSAAAAAASAAIASAIAAANLYPLVFTLAVRDSIFCDGLTGPGRSVAWVPGAAGAIAGRSCTLAPEFMVPTSNPGVDAYLFLFGPVISGGNVTSYTAPWMLLMTISTTGALVLRQGGAASTAADFRQLSYAGFRAAFTGLRVRISVVFASPDSTTAPVIYINGVDVTASFTATSGGFVPNWFPISLDTTRYYVGYNWPSGRIHPQAPILGAFSASEVLDWTQTGHFPTWCEITSGTAVDRITTQADRDFSGAGHWSAQGSGATAVFNSGALDVSLPGNGSTGSSIQLGVGAYMSGSPSPGHRYRLSCKISNYAKTSGTGYLAWYWSSIGAVLLIVTGNGNFSAEFTITTQPAGGGTLRFGEYGSAWAGTFTLDDVSFIELGPIFRPVIQPILVVADAGTNRIPGLLTGYTPITDRREWVIQAETNLATNQQLLGAAVFADPARHVLDDWCIDTTGTPTVTAGSASGSSTYKTSGALAATKNLITLATRVLASVNLWANSNTTDTIKHTIRGHRVD